MKPKSKIRGQIGSHFKLEQLPGGRARILYETGINLFTEPKRGSNRIKPRKKRKK